MACLWSCLTDCFLILRDINTTRDTLGLFGDLEASDTQPLLRNTKYIAINELVNSQRSADAAERLNVKDDILICTQQVSSDAARGLIVLDKHLSFERLQRISNATADYHQLTNLGPPVNNQQIVEKLARESGRLYKTKEKKISELERQLAEIKNCEEKTD